jgi:hypothetical protein
MDLKIILGKLPKDLAHSLLFEKQVDRVIIKAKRPLTPEDFSKLTNIVYDLGGRWVPLGKDSHFEIPIQRQRLLY